MRWIEEQEDNLQKLAAIESNKKEMQLKIRKLQSSLRKHMEDKKVT